MRLDHVILTATKEGGIRDAYYFLFNLADTFFVINRQRSGFRLVGWWVHGRYDGFHDSGGSQRRMRLPLLAASAIAVVRNAWTLI